MSKKTWDVDFESDRPSPEGDFSISFQDRYLFLEDIKTGFLSTQFMNDVMKQVDANENYDVLGKIKRIIDPKDNDITGAPLVAILGTHNEVDKIGYLFGYNEADAWEVLGVYPEQYAEAIKGNKVLLHGFLESLALKPEQWKQVLVVK